MRPIFQITPGWFLTLLPILLILSFPFTASLLHVTYHAWHMSCLLYSHVICMLLVYWSLLACIYPLPGSMYLSLYFTQQSLPARLPATGCCLPMTAATGGHSSVDHLSVDHSKLSFSSFFYPLMIVYTVYIYLSHNDTPALSTYSTTVTNHISNSFYQLWNIHRLTVLLYIDDNPVYCYL